MKCLQIEVVDFKVKNWIELSFTLVRLDRTPTFQKEFDTMSSSIPGRVKPMTSKIDTCRFLA